MKSNWVFLVLPFLGATLAVAQTQSTLAGENTTTKIGPRLELERGEVGRVIAFSPDEKKVLTQGENLYLFDTQTGRKVRDYGKRTPLASADAKHVILKRTREEQIIKIGPTHSHSFRPQQLWWHNLETGQEKKLWEAPQPSPALPYEKVVENVQFAPGGQLLLVTLSQSDISPSAWRSGQRRQEYYGEVWDLKTLRKRRLFSVPREGIFFDPRLAFSHNGRAAFGFKNSISVYDLTTGKSIAQFRPPPHTFNIGLSRDGSMVSGVGYPANVAVWQVAQEKLLFTTTSKNPDVHSCSLDWLPNNRLVMQAGKEAVVGFDPRTGRRFGLNKATQALSRGQLTPSGERVIADKKIYDLQTGSLKTTLADVVTPFQPFEILQVEGKNAWLQYENGRVGCWDMETGRQTSISPVLPRKTLSSPGVLSRDASRWLHATRDGLITLRNVANNKISLQLRTGVYDKRIGIEAIHQLQFSRKQPDIFYALPNYAPFLAIDSRSGKVLRSVNLAWSNTLEYVDVQLSRDETSLIAKRRRAIGTSNQDEHWFEVWDLNSGLCRYRSAPTREEFKLFLLNNSQILVGGYIYFKIVSLNGNHTEREILAPNVDVSPDGTHLRFFVLNDPNIRANGAAGVKLGHQMEAGRSELQQLVGTDNYEVVPLTQQQFIGDHYGQPAFYNENYTRGIMMTAQGLRTYNPRTGEVYYSLMPFYNGEWVVFGANGLYDASSGGTLSALHWVIDNVPVDLGQLKDGFYEPGLQQKRLGLNTEPLRAVPQLASIKLFPEIEVVPPQNDNAQIKLAARDGGYGRVTVWINDKEWQRDARPNGYDDKAGELSIPLTLNAPLIRPGEKNVLKVVAYNSADTLASSPVEVRWVAPGKAEKFEPKLFAILCGISVYADHNKIRTLSFAAKDARDMATALKTGAKSLFGTSNTDIQLLTGEGGKTPKNTLASKANLREAFARVAGKARPQDVLVVFLAGHGTTLGLGSSVYCYPTVEADSTDFSTPDAKAKMVTSEELAEWTKAIPAQKQVLILDTCASGAAGAKLTEKRSPPADQVRAIERLKDRVGYHVLMGCAADSISYEANQFNQGLLTYALLEGMKGPAREAGKGLIEVGAWFQYAQAQVPRLAGSVGGIQQPQIKEPLQEGKAQNFPIAQLSIGDAKALPLNPAGILVLKPRLLDESGEDNLGLENVLKKTLEAARSGQVSVDGVPITGLIYVPVDDLDGAWRISGVYTSQSTRITLELTIRKEGQAPVKRTIQGETAELESLCEHVVATVRNVAFGLSATFPEPSLQPPPSTPRPPQSKKRQRWSLKAGRSLKFEAASYFEGTPAPRADEIALAGHIESLDSQKHEAVLKTLAFRVSNGHAKVIAPSKIKVIRFSPSFDLTMLQTGNEVVVVGREAGGVNPFVVREIF